MRLAKLLLASLVVAAAFGGGYLLRARDARATPSSSSARAVLYWVDPMHPAYRSDGPGIAPDCGMALEPVYADPAGSEAGPAVLYYRGPKDPAYTSTTPGRNPATGQVLEPVHATVATGSGPSHDGAFRLPAERQQLAGVTFGSVDVRDTARVLETVGNVAFDETRVHHVHARVDGWIERVIVDVTGQPVRQGQPMLSIYSPELLASQEELLLARRAREAMRNSPLAGASAQGDALFEAARRRLQLWSLSDAQIEQVLVTGTPIRHVTLHAPTSGVVMQRNAFPQQRVTPETDLYTIADLSTVWVIADVHEGDLGLLRSGLRARITAPGAGGPLVATVSHILPSVDPATRTIKARLDVRNPGLRLRPGMFVDVAFDLPGARHLTVPADAVLDSGERQVVFVDLGNGYLAPRPVTVGERLGDRRVILSGVTEGERVVASGTFLVDAESQLKSALAQMPRSRDASASAAPRPAAAAAADAHLHHGHD